MTEISENELNEVVGGNDEVIGKYIRHVVRPNDCLSALAVRFGSTVEEIARLNNIPDVDKIRVNQVLLIPNRGKLY